MSRRHPRIRNAKRRRRIKTPGRIIIGILLFLFVTILGCAGYAYYFIKDTQKSTPELSMDVVKFVSAPSVVLDDEGNEIIQLSSQGIRKTEAKSGEIPDILKWAFIDLEDERFYEHKGYDPKGMLRAAYVYIRKKEMQGASTITQQLIKNVVFNTGMDEKTTLASIKRKIHEITLAKELEEKVDKTTILTAYLNVINLGDGNYGIKEAAKYYFGKSLDELTVSECAVIAAITQNPSGNNPIRHQDRNRTRMEACLGKLLENGHISQEEYEEAVNDNVYDRLRPSPGTAGEQVYSYFIDDLVLQVLNDLQEYYSITYDEAHTLLYTGGLTIKSTQNTAAQEMAEAQINNPDNYPGVNTSYSVLWSMTVESGSGERKKYTQNDLKIYYRGQYGPEYHLDFPSEEDAQSALESYKSEILSENDKIISESCQFTLQPQASFVLMDYRNGHVLVSVGGRGEKKYSMSLSRASDVLRQPGSTFKIPAAFAPALDSGTATLATAYDDCPFTYMGSDKKVSNWWGDNVYMGLSTIRLGIQDSMNIVACKTMYDTGVKTSMEYIRSFGYSYIDPVLDANLATAIGGVTKGVTNLENCTAFSSIANNGIYNAPVYYTEIIDINGNVILNKDEINESHRVIQKNTSQLLTNAMLDVVTAGTGKGGGIEGTPLAAKTGTTNECKDLWYVGYIPNGLCSALWIGYDDNLLLDKASEIQKPFYSKIMTDMVSVFDAWGGEFVLGENIECVYICTKSGRLATDLCERDGCAKWEYFRTGTAPDKPCETHILVKVCAESGLIPNEYCKNTYDKICIVRPPDTDGTEPKGTTLDSEKAVPQDKCTIHKAPETTTTSETTTEETSESKTTEETVPDTEPSGEDLSPVEPSTTEEESSDNSTVPVPTPKPPETDTHGDPDNIPDWQW